MIEIEVLTCSCCGRGIHDTVQENVSHGKSPYPHDAGYGMCVVCGGDKKATGLKKRLGWAGRTFYEARFEVLRKALSPTLAAKFETMTYTKKVAVVAQMIEKGVLI